MLIHHFAKAASGKINGLADARAAILGAASWVNNGRWAFVLWEATHDEAHAVRELLERAHHVKQAGLVYFGRIMKGNAGQAKLLRTLVRDTKTGILEDVTDELRRLAPKRDEVDALLYADLIAMKQADERFSFTTSPTALWKAWGSIIRKRDLPTTKDGKARGREGVQTVFDRMLASGWLAQTDDRGKTPRYEPIKSVPLNGV